MGQESDRPTGSRTDGGARRPAGAPNDGRAKGFAGMMRYARYLKVNDDEMLSLL